MAIVIIILAAMATWYLPLPGKIIALAINYAVPDPVPFLDEAIQAIGLLKNLISAVRFVVGLLATLLKWAIVLALIAGGVALILAFPPLAGVAAVGLLVWYIWRRRQEQPWSHSAAHAFHPAYDDGYDGDYDADD